MKVSLGLAVFFILFLGAVFSVFIDGWAVGLLIPLGGDVQNIFILLKNVILFFSGESSGKLSPTRSSWTRIFLS